MTTRRLRVCHVTTAHIRKDTRIFRKQCRSLADAGYDVHLVVGDGRGPEVADGVTIHDIGSKQSSRVRRMLAQPRRAARLVQSIAPDVVHFHDPELLPLGVRLADSGLRVIYDAHEDVPRQILGKKWIPVLLRVPVSRLFAAYQRRAARRMTGIVGATPHIARGFQTHPTPVECVNNYPLAEELAAPGGAAARGTNLCYVGAISRERGIVPLVRAMALVPGARLTLCGSIDATIEAELAAEPGWAQVDYRGEIDRESVREVMAESAAGVVTFLPDPNHVEAQPTKLFEYMSASLPVIASAFPLWREFVERNGAGLCVNPADPAAIAGAIRAILGDPERAVRMGRAGREAIMNDYNWSRESAKLLAFYDRLTGV